MDTLFALDMGDGPLMLIAEVALSVAVIAAIMLLVRMANARSGHNLPGDTKSTELGRPAVPRSGSVTGSVSATSSREAGEPGPTEPIRE